tara:strand:- start:216 stop:743 length:528 start_codon:yes stop_codon:yes gene_type:complete
MTAEDFELNEPINSDESNVHQPSEPSPEQKIEISGWVAEGMGLSDIQKKINNDFGIVMTYMDVRFLVDDLNLTLVDQEEETKPEEKSEAGNDQTDVSPDTPLETQGGVSVEVDTVTPPGAMASGTVVFSDGQSKKWTLDQFGRLGLSGGDEGYKPSDEDVMEFQKQLDASLRGRF